MALTITVEMKPGNKKAVCDCPDQQCYLDCADQFLDVLRGMARAGTSEHFATGQKAPGKKGDLTISYHVTDDSGVMAFCIPEIKVPNASDAMRKQAAQLFDQCCAHPAVKKTLKP